MRRELGWTQSQLGERVGATASYISAVEAGRENLTLGALARLAEAFGRGLEVRFPSLDAEYRNVDVDGIMSRAAASRSAAVADQ